jgi:hypothetical protein
LNPAWIAFSTVLQYWAPVVDLEEELQEKASAKHYHYPTVKSEEDTSVLSI